jgi:hypothetical protein
MEAIDLNTHLNTLSRLALTLLLRRCEMIVVLSSIFIVELVESTQLDQRLEAGQTFSRSEWVSIATD